MRLDLGQDATEHGCGHNMHFVQQNKTPFAALEEVHHFLGGVRPFAGVGDHGVGRHDNASGARELLFLIGCKYTDLGILNIAPLQKLLAPLHDTHTTRAQDKTALLDRACRSDTNERLASAAGKHDNAAASTAVTKHFGKALFLVWPDMRYGLEIDIEVWIQFVVSKIVLLQHWEAKIVAPSLDSLNFLFADFEAVHGIVFIEFIGIVYANHSAEQVLLAVLRRLFSALSLPMLIAISRLGGPNTRVTDDRVAQQ